MNKVKMELVGLDGNAFSILGAFQKEARTQGWDSSSIKSVIDEAMSGNYDHLLRTIVSNVEECSDTEEDLDYCGSCGSTDCWGECEDEEEEQEEEEV